MSASYGWRPVKPQRDRGLSLATASLIADRSHCETSELKGARIDRSMVPWLEGVNAATDNGGVRDDTAALLEALENVEEVEITISY